MTDIRFRTADGVAVKVGDVPFDQLDSVIPTLKAWGVSDRDGTLLDTDGLSAQFVYDDERGEFFFEVISGGEE